MARTLEQQVIECVRGSMDEEVIREALEEDNEEATKDQVQAAISIVFLMVNAFLNSIEKGFSRKDGV